MKCDKTGLIHPRHKIRLKRRFQAFSSSPFILYTTSPTVSPSSPLLTVLQELGNAATYTAGDVGLPMSALAWECGGGGGGGLCWAQIRSGWWGLRMEIPNSNKLIAQLFSLNRGRENTDPAWPATPGKKPGLKRWSGMAFEWRGENRRGGTTPNPDEHTLYITGAM